VGTKRCELFHIILLEGRQESQRLLNVMFD
jgi:hypothetical protein